MSAIQYAAAGWYIFPAHSRDGTACSCGAQACPNPGKHPRTRNGDLDATTDPAIIAEWWTRWPDAHVGLALKPSGLVALDIEGPAKTEVGLAWLEAHDADLTETRMQRTPSGGVHALYRRVDDSQAQRRIRWRPGVDLLGSGYVILSPSTGYGWIDPDAEIAPLPPLLAAGFLEKPAARPRVDVGETFPPASPELLESVWQRCLRVGPSIRGQGGDKHAYSLGALLGHGYALSWDESLGLMKRWRDHFPENTWSDDRLADKLEHGIRYGKGTRGAERHSWDLDQAVLRVGEEMVAESRAARPSSMGIAVTGVDTNLAGFAINEKTGKPLPTQENIGIALERLGVALRHDVFADRLRIRIGNAGAELPLDDAIVIHTWLAVDRLFGFRPAKELWFDVVMERARRTPFHPVCDYLDGLQWDGAERLDRWLVDYGGAEDSPYTRAVGRLVLTAAVRRVRSPGCKFDELLILESAQGTNKSSALQILAVREAWFTDDLPLGVDGKRAIEALAGHWIAEAGELAGMRRGEVADLKSFLSRRVDKARLSYARTPTEHPRQCVIIGTTNDDRYLKDPTGNRRFWPVKVVGFDLGALARDRDQIWAEASVVERSGASIRLDPALYPAAAEVQSDREMTDPWLDVITAVLGDAEGEISAGDLLGKVLGIPVDRQTHDHAGRLGKLMAASGWGSTRRGRSQTRIYHRGSCHPITLGLSADRLTWSVAG